MVPDWRRFWGLRLSGVYGERVVYVTGSWVVVRRTLPRPRPLNVVLFRLPSFLIIRS